MRSKRKTQYQVVVATAGHNFTLYGTEHIAADFDDFERAEAHLNHLLSEAIGIKITNEVSKEYKIEKVISVSIRKKGRVELDKPEQVYSLPIVWKSTKQL